MVEFAKCRCMCQEAEFLDVIGAKVLRVFLLAIHSHLLLIDLTPPPLPPLSKSGLKLFCNVNNVYGNLTQEYAQKPQRNYTFMNSASALERRYVTSVNPGCGQHQFLPVPLDYSSFLITLLATSLEHVAGTRGWNTWLEHVAGTRGWNTGLEHVVGTRGWNTWLEHVAGTRG
jgi:hypothetical protein